MREMAAGPPDLSERQTCHKARDNYFNCLDTHNDVASSCEELKKAMQAVCRPTWVKYFEQKRINDKRKKMLDNLPPDYSNEAGNDKKAAAATVKDQ